MQTLVHDQPISNFTQVEVSVPAAALSQVAIPDQPMLKSYANRRTIIKSIEFVSPKIQSHAVLSGLALMTRAEALKAVLVLYCNGWEKVQYIPLLRLNGVHDSDATTATTIPFMASPATFADLKEVDWTKSYIKYANGQTSSGSAYAIVFNVQYMILNDQGQSIRP